MSDNHQWHYLKTGLLNEDQIGPVTESEFKLLATSGGLKPKTVVMSPTRTKGNWIELNKIPGLLKLVEDAADKKKRRKQIARQEKLTDRAVQRAAAKRRKAELAEIAKTEPPKQELITDAVPVIQPPQPIIHAVPLSPSIAMPQGVSILQRISRRSAKGNSASAAGAADQCHSKRDHAATNISSATNAQPALRVSCSPCFWPDWNGLLDTIRSVGDVNNRRVRSRFMLFLDRVSDLAVLLDLLHLLGDRGL